MAAARHLVVVYVVTAGQHGEGLGCDEQEIVMLTWLVVDTINNKVVAVQQHIVKPRCSDINDNLLSDICKNEIGLADDVIKNGQPLEQVLDQLDQFVRTKFDNNLGRTFHLITDGQLHLRQVIHPETCQKNILLPDYYSTFFDLRKEFGKFYSTEDIYSIQDMLKFLLSF
uniref:Epithelial splicing regulatory protein 1 n=1 Tax=Hadrurus spadix TaxID=141984 RepID=A0A1W7RAM2_9SCOR